MFDENDDENYDDNDNSPSTFTNIYRKFNRWKKYFLRY